MFPRIINRNLIAAGVVLIIAAGMVVIQMIIEKLRPVFGKIWLGLIAGCLILLVLTLSVHFARARDTGQWENADPAVTEWYRALMQPDAPESSCCGEADAYWADEIHVRDGKTFATITDDRPDAPRGRPHVEIGTVIEIPPEKLKWDRSNPTGHGIVFLSRAGYVFCYVQPTGI